MTETYPSPRVVIADIPDVKNVQSEFVYNYYTKDETIAQSSLLSISASLPDVYKRLNNATNNVTNTSTNSTNFLRYVPRYIKLTWNPVIINSTIDSGKYSVQALNEQNKIYSEEDIVSNLFSNIPFQDTQIDDKMSFFINRMVDSVVASNPNLSKETLSQQDLSKILNANTSTDVTSNFISDALSDLSKTGYKFEKSTGAERIAVIKDTILQTLKSVKTDMMINNKFVLNTLQTVSENPVNVYIDEINSTALIEAEKIQNAAITQFDSSVIRNSDYETTNTQIIDVQLLKNNTFFIPQSTIIGYIIQKQEITSNNTIIEHSPMYVESPFVGSTIDFNVKYSSKYQYKISSVALVEGKAPNTTTSEIYKYTICIRSRYQLSNIVSCQETVSPPPPADFNIHWDYDTKKPILTWSLPTNPQRDIKYFQIFRRKNIDEPYQLIGMYDFNDSYVIPTLNESYIDINDSKTYFNLESALTNYMDEEFDKDTSTYIYTVCCIDAHGFGSNYGPQIMISFDKFKNKLIKKLVSRANAPKAYPNYYLLEDLFKDTIKVSSAISCSLYFNPEYIEVYRTGDDGHKDYENLIAYNSGSSYKLQFINIDLQQQQIFDFKIKNYVKYPPSSNVITETQTIFTSGTNYLTF